MKKRAQNHVHDPEKLNRAQAVVRSANKYIQIEPEQIVELKKVGGRRTAESYLAASSTEPTS